MSDSDDMAPPDEMAESDDMAPPDEMAESDDMAPPDEMAESDDMAPPEEEALAEDDAILCEPPPDGEVPAEGEPPPEDDAILCEPPPDGEVPAEGEPPAEEEAPAEEELPPEVELPAEDDTLPDNVLTKLYKVYHDQAVTGSWSSGVCGYGTAIYLLDSGTLSESDGTYEASSTDESAVCVTGSSSEHILNNPVISTTGDSSSDEESSFYGLNAAVLNYDGGDLTINGGTIETTGSGANAVFAYGTGTTTVNDTSIVATDDFAHGLFAAGGGTMIVNNVNATTSGTSSSVVGTDRGSGTIEINGGSYTASGMRSAGIYSTGIITATDATFTATNAEAVVVEGSNIVTLNDVTLNATSGLTEHRGIFLYQSMSGDADNSECGTGACFTMTGGTYNYTDTSNSSTNAPENCAAFAIANQTAHIELNDVEVNNSCPTLLLSALNTNWNFKGGIASLIANGVSLTGDVIVDNVSTADISLKSSNSAPSSLTGAINSDNTGSSVTVTLDAESQWVVTDNSYLTSLTNEDSTNSNIACKTSGCKVFIDGVEIDIQ
jgi:hypothetical protein